MHRSYGKRRDLYLVSIRLWAWYSQPDTVGRYCSVRMIWISKNLEIIHFVFICSLQGAIKIIFCLIILLNCYVKLLILRFSMFLFILSITYFLFYFLAKQEILDFIDSTPPIQSIIHLERYDQYKKIRVKLINERLTLFKNICKNLHAASPKKTSKNKNIWNPQKFIIESIAF